MRFYADIFYFPWLRYRVNSPSGGYELYGIWETRLGPLRGILRYKRERKSINSDVQENYYAILPQLKEYCKLRIIWPVSEKLQLQTRLETSRFKPGDESNSYGYFFCQDVSWFTISDKLELSGRMAWFHAEEYETRIYAYERDISFAGFSQMHYGKGWRLMFLVKWQLSAQLRIGAKIAQSRYPDKTSIGTGLNEIQGNRRTEIKFQIMADF